MEKCFSKPQGFSISATKDTCFRALSVRPLCSFTYKSESPHPTKGEETKERARGSDRGWSKRANRSHLGHFPRWGGQREHSGTHWMPATPTRLRLSSKASNAHFRVSAWSTVFTTSGCAVWVNMDVHNRPNVWKKLGTLHWVSHNGWASSCPLAPIHSSLSPGPNAS